jgi:voltage-gated potassium channel
MTLDEEIRARFILRKNKEYFIFSLLTFILLLIPHMINFHPTFNNMIYPLFFILFYYYFSRVNEIFISFLIDVQEKLTKQYKFSFISFRDRIKLAFYSYLELIINYALMFWIIDYSFGVFNREHLNLLEHLYFSCVTISTLGYGDIYAIHFIPQLLSVYEVFNGMLLVIVCFTIYVSLNFNQELCCGIEDYKNNYRPDYPLIQSNYERFKAKNKINFIIGFSALLFIFVLAFFVITDYFPTNRGTSFIIYSLFTILIIQLLKKRKLEDKKN